jgi:hypothetical protein
MTNLPPLVATIRLDPSLVRLVASSSRLLGMTSEEIVARAIKKYLCADYVEPPVTPLGLKLEMDRVRPYPPARRPPDLTVVGGKEVRPDG